MNRFNVVFGVVATVALVLGITAMFMSMGNASSASRDTASAVTQQRTATAKLRVQVRALKVNQGKTTVALGKTNVALGKNTITLAKDSGLLGQTTAKAARQGVCWSVSYGTASGDFGDYAEDVTIDAPIITSGVTTCPTGDTFVPVG